MSATSWRTWSSLKPWTSSPTCNRLQMRPSGTPSETVFSRPRSPLKRCAQSFWRGDPSSEPNNVQVNAWFQWILIAGSEASTRHWTDWLIPGSARTLSTITASRSWPPPDSSNLRPLTYRPVPLWLPLHMARPLLNLCFCTSLAAGGGRVTSSKPLRHCAGVMYGILSWSPLTWCLIPRTGISSLPGFKITGWGWSCVAASTGSWWVHHVSLGRYLGRGGTKTTAVHLPSDTSTICGAWTSSLSRKGARSLWETAFCSTAALPIWPNGDKDVVPSLNIQPSRVPLLTPLLQASGDFGHFASLQPSQGAIVRGFSKDFTRPKVRNLRISYVPTAPSHSQHWPTLCGQDRDCRQPSEWARRPKVATRPMNWRSIQGHSTRC